MSSFDEIRQSSFSVSRTICAAPVRYTYPAWTSALLKPSALSLLPYPLSLLYLRQVTHLTGLSLPYPAPCSLHTLGKRAAQKRGGAAAGPRWSAGGA
jgi:hypothetical protein